jgi:hypothetical protein
METQIGAIDCDAVELDHLAKNYDAFLRSLRIIRALLGCITWFVIVIPLELGLASYFLIVEPPTNARGETSSAWSFFLSWQYSAVMTIYSLLIVSIWYIFFYLFRNVSAGSIRSARFMVALMLPVLLLNVLSAVFWIFLLGYLILFNIPRDPVNQSSSSLDFSIIAPAISWNLVGVYTAYLLVTGLVRRIKGRNQPFHRLFHDQKYSREFRPGWAALLHNFWLVMGISTPPRKVRRATRVTRVTIAAVCAFMLEGFMLTAYMWPLTPLYLLVAHEPHHGEYEQYQEEFSLSLEFVRGAVLILFIMAWCWGIFSLTRILRRYARRHSLVSAAAAMLADPRKPVVFLRSFSDDQISLSNAKMRRLLRFVDPGGVVGTLEELLVSEYADAGPVIAIGKPSDDLPPLGAARRYCQGTEWQEIVRSLMQASALIVVGVGRSAGLAWEIATIRAASLLTKTVFVFPPDLAKDRSMLHDLFMKLDLNENIPQFRTGQAVISVSFLALERPLLLLSSRVTETVYQIAVRAAKEPDVIPRARNLDVDTHSPAMPAFRARAG